MSAKPDIGKNWQTASGIQKLERLRLAIIYLGLELEQKEMMEEIFGKIEAMTQ